jgi:hypothetical protein
VEVPRHNRLTDQPKAASAVIAKPLSVPEYRHPAGVAAPRGVTRSKTTHLERRESRRRGGSVGSGLGRCRVSSSPPVGATRPPNPPGGAGQLHDTQQLTQSGPSHVGEPVTVPVRGGWLDRGWAVLRGRPDPLATTAKDAKWYWTGSRRLSPGNA